ncbi:MAG: hypothetical protein NW226_16965 [Microscillaceae bacterium]|nr:hypothetical protein [Microscillaceae bacterium]
MDIKELIDMNAIMNIDSLLNVARSSNFYIFKLSANNLSGITTSSCISQDSLILRFSTTDSIITFDYNSIEMDNSTDNIGFWSGKKQMSFHTQVELIIFKLKNKLVAGYTLDGCDIILDTKNILERIINSKDDLEELNMILQKT